MVPIPAAGSGYSHITAEDMGAEIPYSDEDLYNIPIIGKSHNKLLRKYGTIKNEYNRNNKSTN